MPHPATSASGFFLIAAVAALVWHLFLKSYGPAALGAAVTTAVLFRVVDYFIYGYLEPYFYAGLAMSILPALVIAGIIGLPFKIYRTRHTKD